MNHDLADNLLRLRKARGLTQEQLAGQLGVSPQSVSKWENCQSYPDIELLPHLAEVFSVSIDALLGYRREKLRTSQYESKYRSPAYYWGNDVWSGWRNASSTAPAAASPTGTAWTCSSPAKWYKARRPTVMPRVSFCLSFSLGALPAP